MTTNYVEKYVFDRYMTKEEIYFREGRENFNFVWDIIKNYRFSNRIEIPLRYKEINLWFCITPKIQDSIDYLNAVAKDNIIMRLNGQIQSIIKKENLLEESMSSSFIEGAFSTKKRIRELITLREEPKDKNEKMILNNYEVLKFVADNLDNDFEMSLIIEIQKIITKNTLDVEDIDPNYRIEPVFVTDSKGENIHIAPPHEIVPELMNKLYLFANNNKSVSPLIKSAIIHFYFVYIHPFSDGNGRTSRALQYFYLLKEGYEIFKMFSISSMLKEERSKYYKSIKDSENDFGDITYFIEFNLEMICRSVQNVISKAIREYKKQFIFISAKQKGIFLTERHKKIIELIIKKELKGADIEMYVDVNNVKEETARTDLNKLIEYGIFNKKKEGKKFVYFLENEYILK